MAPETLALIETGTAKKGDVLATARIAGIMAAKKTHELIPLCHPLAITKATVEFEASHDPAGLRVTAEVKVGGQTGVEMEALTAVSVACLTIYDMLKAADKAMVLGDIRLVEKTGGRSGTYTRGRSARGSRQHGSGALRRRGTAAASWMASSRPAESVPIGCCRGRTLAAPLAARSHPAAVRCLGDGRLRRAPRRCPHAALPRSTEIGQAAAGHPFAGSVGPGQAVRIFTGAPVPDGADAIVIQENVARDGANIIVRDGVAERTTSARRASTSASATPCSAPDAASARASCRWPPPWATASCPFAGGRAWRSWRPATSWCSRAAASGPDRSSPPTIWASPRWPRRRRRGPPARHRPRYAREPRCSHRQSAGRRRARHDRRRLGRRSRPGGAGAGGARHGAGVLEDRDAAGQTADVRPPGRLPRAGAAGQSGVGHRLRAACSWCR